MNPILQRPILGASAAVFHADKILLVKRGQNPGKGLWSLPGGKIEFGETAKAAAAREVLEETGIAASIGQLAGLYEIIGPEMHFAIACFTATTISTSLRAASDAAAAQFFNLDQIAALPLAPNTLRAIHDAKAYHQF